MDGNGSSGAVALLGLEGFVVRSAIEVDGELHQLIETTADRVGCPSCGVVAVPHGRRRVWVRDLPAGGRPVALRGPRLPGAHLDRDDPGHHAAGVAERTGPT